MKLSVLLVPVLLVPACSSGVTKDQPCDCTSCVDDSCRTDSGETAVGDADSVPGESDNGDGHSSGDGGDDGDGDDGDGDDGDGDDGDGDSSDVPIYDPLDGLAPTRGAFSSPSVTPRILIVDTLAPDVSGNETTGRGTFRWAYTRAYPRVILFEVSGVIDFTTSLAGQDWFLYIKEANQSYVTVAGESAPSPGITLKSATLGINNDVHDVTLRHLKIRRGDEQGTGAIGATGDCLTLVGVEKVLVENCSLTWSQDEIVDLYNPGTDITFRNNILGDPLNISQHFNENAGLHEMEAHGLPLLTVQPTNVVMIQNLFAHGLTRNPAITGGTSLVINNVIHGNNGPVFYNASGDYRAAVIGNTVYPITDPWFVWDSQKDKAVLINANTAANLDLFLSNNICQKSILTPGAALADTIWYTGTLALDSFLVDASPIDLSAYQGRIITNGLASGGPDATFTEVDRYVLRYAGARPNDRDEVDASIIERVRTRAGKTVNSPEALPARAMCVAYVKISGDCTSHSMQNGFDWSGAAATTISVNGTIIDLDQNCTTGTTADERFACVASMLTDQLPTELEVFRVFGPGYFIGIRTKAAGASQSLTVSGPGLVDLGIPAATYAGSDATGGLPTAHATRAVDSIPGHPASPFADDDQDGFSNLEEFLAGLARDLVL